MGGEWSEKKGVGLLVVVGERDFFFFVMWILVAFCWFGTLCSRYPSAGVGLGVDFVSISNVPNNECFSSLVKFLGHYPVSVAASHSPLLSCL